MFKELQDDLNIKIDSISTIIEQLNNNKEVENLGMVISALRVTLKKLKSFQTDYENEAYFYKIDLSSLDYSFEESYMFNSEDKDSTIEFLLKTKEVLTLMNDKLATLER